MGEFLGRVASVYLERKHRLAETKFLQQSLTWTDIETMDEDNDGEVDKAEFLSYMLVTLQRVDQEEIDTLMNLFNKLDVDKSGTLSKDDLKETIRKGLQSVGKKPNPQQATGYGSLAM